MARKRSVCSGDWPRSSPNTRPRKRLRSDRDQPAVPRSRVRLTALASRWGGFPLSTMRTSAPVANDIEPATPRRAARTSSGALGFTLPETQTRSPISRSANTPAAGPRAHTVTRWPSIRSSAKRAPATHSGSDANSPTPSILDGTSGAVEPTGVSSRNVQSAAAATTNHHTDHSRREPIARPSPTMPTPTHNQTLQARSLRRCPQSPTYHPPVTARSNASGPTFEVNGIHLEGGGVPRRITPLLQGEHDSPRRWIWRSPGNLAQPSR